MMSAGAPYGIMRAAIHRLCGISGSEPLEMQQQRLRTRVAQNLAPADADRVVLFVGEACHVPFSEESKPMLQAARQDPKIMHYRLRQALLDLLAAECSAAPVLLVLDDLQWGDEPSVSVLDEALRTQAGAALFVLAFARPEVHEVFPKLWQSHRVQEIPLKGLSRKACERLIAQVLGKNVTVDVVARAVEQAAGNALFLEELIRSIAEGKSEEQSETVLAMLQARLGRLDANLRRTIRAASIFGQTFWRSGVATVLGLSPMDREVETWLSTLVDAEMIQSHPQSPLGNKSEYGFRHALVRDAAYGLLTSSDLTTGHRLAAEFLEAAGELDAAIIAEHFERSGERRHAARCFLRAAEDNFKQADYRGVLEHVKRGLACEPEGELRGQLCGIKGSTYYRLGQYDQIGEAGDVALKLVPVGSLGWCRAIVAAYMAAFARQDGAGASELMSLLIRTEPERVAQAEYASTLVFCLMTSLMAAPASTLNAIIQMVRVIVAQLERVDPMSRRHLCLVLALMVTFRTYGPWTLVSECQRAIDLADQAGDTEMSLGNRAGLIGLIEWGWLDLGDREGAERRLMALASMIDKTQEMGPVGVWRNQLARVLCMANDEASWAKAEQLLAPLFVPAKGFDIFSILAQGVMARISLLRGRLSEAEAQARALMPFFPAMPIWIAHSAPVQIRALLGLGRADEAVAVAVQFLDAIPMLGGYGVAEVEFRLAATEAFHAAGNIERAHIEMRETLRQIQLRADDIPDPFWKNSYLTRNPYCVEALRIAKEWGMDA
jgi:tetratricopeptide (TPR) repeat protein